MQPPSSPLPFAWEPTVSRLAGSATRGGALSSERLAEPARSLTGPQAPGPAPGPLGPWGAGSTGALVPRIQWTERPGPPMTVASAPPPATTSTALRPVLPPLSPGATGRPLSASFARLLETPATQPRGPLPGPGTRPSPVIAVSASAPVLAAFPVPRSLGPTGAAQAAAMSMPMAAMSMPMAAMSMPMAAMPMPMAVVLAGTSVRSTPVLQTRGPAVTVFRGSSVLRHAFPLAEFFAPSSVADTLAEAKAPCVSVPGGPDPGSAAPREVDKYIAQRDQHFGQWIQALWQKARVSGSGPRALYHVPVAFLTAPASPDIQWSGLRTPAWAWLRALRYHYPPDVAAEENEQRPGLVGPGAGTTLSAPASTVHGPWIQAPGGPGRGPQIHVPVLPLSLTMAVNPPNLDRPATTEMLRPNRLSTMSTTPRDRLLLELRKVRDQVIGAGDQGHPAWVPLMVRRLVLGNKDLVTVWLDVTSGHLTILDCNAHVPWLGPATENELRRLLAHNRVTYVRPLVLGELLRTLGQDPRLKGPWVSAGSAQLLGLLVTHVAMMRGVDPQMAAEYVDRAMAPERGDRAKSLGLDVPTLLSAYTRCILENLGDPSSIVDGLLQQSHRALRDSEPYKPAAGEGGAGTGPGAGSGPGSGRGAGAGAGSSAAGGTAATSQSAASAASAAGAASAASAAAAAAASAVAKDPGESAIKGMGPLGLPAMDVEEAETAVLRSWAQRAVHSRLFAVASLQSPWPGEQAKQAKQGAGKALGSWSDCNHWIPVSKVVSLDSPESSEKPIASGQNPDTESDEEEEEEHEHEHEPDDRESYAWQQQPGRPAYPEAEPDRNQERTSRVHVHRTLTVFALVTTTTMRLPPRLVVSSVRQPRRTRIIDLVRHLSTGDPENFAGAPGCTVHVLHQAQEAEPVDKAARARQASPGAARRVVATELTPGQLRLPVGYLRTLGSAGAAEDQEEPEGSGTPLLPGQAGVLRLWISSDPVHHKGTQRGHWQRPPEELVGLTTAQQARWLADHVARWESQAQVPRDQRTLHIELQGHGLEWIRHGPKDQGAVVLHHLRREALALVLFLARPKRLESKVPQLLLHLRKRGRRMREASSMSAPSLTPASSSSSSSSSWPSSYGPRAETSEQIDWTRHAGTALVLALLWSAASGDTQMVLTMDDAVLGQSRGAGGEGRPDVLRSLDLWGHRARGHGAAVSEWPTRAGDLHPLAQLFSALLSRDKAPDSRVQTYWDSLVPRFFTSVRGPVDDTMHAQVAQALFWTEAWSKRRLLFLGPSVPAAYTERPVAAAVDHVHLGVQPYMGRTIQGPRVRSVFVRAPYV